MRILVSSGTCRFNNVICSGSSAASTRVKESAMSPPRVSLRESVEESTQDISKTENETSTTSLAFVYGTLKRGFGNHWLMEEQTSKKHARLVGTAQTKSRFPLVCGPFQVPFLLQRPGHGEHVLGELYLVDSHCLKLLDELEGVTKAHYQRSSVVLSGLELDPSFKFSLQNGLNGFSIQQGHSLLDAVKQPGEIIAEAYFAAEHYTPGLYLAPHIPAYTEKESATYIRRMHRPQNRTFIEHVNDWVEQQQQLKTTSGVNN